MYLLKKSFALVILIFISAFVFAQSAEEAGAKYNEGNEAIKAKQYGTAVTAYEAALKIAKAAPDAGDLTDNIEKQLINAYYKNGIASYKKKKFDASVSNLEKSMAMSKVSDPAMFSKTSTVLAKVRSAWGNTLINDGKLDQAFSEYEMALEVDPNCVIAYYGKGLVFKEKDDMANMMKNMDKAIEIGSANPKEAKTVAKVKAKAASTLVNEGAKEIQKERGKQAIVYINDSFKYEPGTTDAYYYLAIAYNKTKQFGDAVNAANKAIELKTEGDKSDIYFEMGRALEGQGDASGACAAFKKVIDGPNVEAAKYKMTQSLNCG